MAGMSRGGISTGPQSKSAMRGTPYKATLLARDDLNPLGHSGRLMQKSGSMGSVGSNEERFQRS